MKRVVVFLAVVSVVAAAGLLAADSYRAKLLGQIVNVQADTSSPSSAEPTFVVFWIILLPMVGLKNPLTYRALRFEGRGEIRTGTYRVKPGTTLLSLIDAIEKGRVVTETLTIVEGSSNRWQIREQLEREQWMDGPTFDALCDDQDFLRTLKIPGPNCEGFIFPETYQFARGVSPKFLMTTFLRAWRETIDAVVSSGRGPMGLDDLQFTTLASIVEKETGAAEERPRIACVFYNRMKESPPWRLETDPTVIYAATLADPTFDGNIKRSHLRTFDHPYNTYKRRGLPPGPIASPGRAALQAVQSPSECSDFFFVSMNNGEHVFVRPMIAIRQRFKNGRSSIFETREGKDDETGFGQCASFTMSSYRGS